MLLPWDQVKALCWNRRIFLRDSMGFHGFLCDSMPTPLVGSRRFLLYDHLSVVSRRFYPSIMYIMSQSPPSYLRIDTLSPSASTLSTAFHPQSDGQIKKQNSTMEAYLRAFVNYKQDDWARLLPIAEFAYNNAKNASTGHTPFELNCGFHPRTSYEEDVDPRPQSKSADKLATELRELMNVCRENLQHAQELQKRYHDKHAKPKSYALGKKVWLNSKYIKTKRNCKLETKFFGPF